MIGFPFDSQVTYDEHDQPVYDRAVSSQPLRDLIRGLFNTGVLLHPSTCLKVSAGADGMTVVVNAGFAVIDGGLCREDNQRTLEVTAADQIYDRIDTVVIRWNENINARSVDLYVVAGVPAASPVRPELQRDNSVYEIGLADIFITKRSSSITNEKITDTRYDSDRCGIITSQNFEEYLQDEIDDINDLLGSATLQTVAQTITAAINEVKAKADQGSAVTITPALNTGTKVADYSINGTAGILYAPKGMQKVLEKDYYSEPIDDVSDDIRTALQGKSNEDLAQTILMLNSEVYHVDRSYTSPIVEAQFVNFRCSLSNGIQVNHFNATVTSDSQAMHWTYAQVYGLTAGTGVVQGENGRYTANGQDASGNFTGKVIVLC